MPYGSTREDSKPSPKRNVSRPTVTLRLKKTWPYLEDGRWTTLLISRAHTTSLTAGGWLRRAYVVCRSPSTLYVSASMQLLRLVGILNLLARALPRSLSTTPLWPFVVSRRLNTTTTQIYRVADCLDPEFKNCGCRLLHYMSIGNNKESVVEPVPTLCGGLAGGGWEVTRASCCVWNMKCTYSS